jgi:hypothetical protein
MTPNVNRLVIHAMADDESFISRKVASHADLENYASLGGKIAWDSARTRT